MPGRGIGFGRGRVLQNCEKLEQWPFHRDGDSPSQWPSGASAVTQQFTTFNVSQHSSSPSSLNVGANGGCGGGFASTSAIHQSQSCEGRCSDAFAAPVPDFRNRDSKFGGAQSKLNSVYAAHEQKLDSLESSEYEECEEVRELNEAAVSELRERKNNLTVIDLAGADVRTSRSIPKPIWRFEQAFGSNAEMMKILNSMDFVEPSPIQCQMWPILLRGFDCIGVAQTGTGKTLGFLLPAFMHIDRQRCRRSPSVLILTPTRELACQIEKEAKKFAYNGYRSLCVYGGTDRLNQVYSCRFGMDILIATPGRLNDLLESKDLNVRGVSYLVLDEADRMLDMGFRPQIDTIVDTTRRDRLTVLTSATWPSCVRELARAYTREAMQVVVGSLDLTACETIHQEVRVVWRYSEKMDVLFEEVLKMHGKDVMLVFVNRKRDADSVYEKLLEQGVKCMVMHGGKMQCEREEALLALRKSKIRVLVATDVASRGIDVPNISHVFNYDFPTNMEEYVHRIGRTGRAGHSGKSITLVSRKENYRAAPLIRILEKNSQHVPPELRRLADEFRKQQEELGDDGNDGILAILNGEVGNEKNPADGEAHVDFYNQKEAPRRSKSAAMRNAIYDPFTDEYLGELL